MVEDDDEVTLDDMDNFHSLRSEKSTTLKIEEGAVTLSADEKFHSMRSSLTMINSPQHEDHGDETLAESIVDSMHTALDTLDGGDKDDDNTMNDGNNDSGDEQDFLEEEMLPLDPRKVEDSTPTPPAT